MINNLIKLKSKPESTAQLLRDLPASTDFGFVKSVREHC